MKTLKEFLKTLKEDNYIYVRLNKYISKYWIYNLIKN